MRPGVKTTGSIMLLLTAIIWGCSFVAQSEAMDYMGPLTFQAARSFVGSAVLIPVLLLAGRGRKKYHTPQPNGSGRKKLFLAGTLCGVVMFAAAMLQQYGIAFGTSGGKAGFITATYILLVPLFGLFRGKKVTLKIWACVLVALCGLYLLCITGGFSFAPSDGLMLLENSTSKVLGDIPSNGIGTAQVKLKALNELSSPIQELNLELKYRYDNGKTSVPVGSKYWTDGLLLLMWAFYPAA